MCFGIWIPVVLLNSPLLFSTSPAHKRVPLHPQPHLSWWLLHSTGCNGNPIRTNEDQKPRPPASLTQLCKVKSAHIPTNIEGEESHPITTAYFFLERDFKKKELGHLSLRFKLWSATGSFGKHYFQSTFSKRSSQTHILVQRAFLKQRANNSWDPCRLGKKKALLSCWKSLMCKTQHCSNLRHW